MNDGAGCLLSLVLIITVTLWLARELFAGGKSGRPGGRRRTWVCPDCDHRNPDFREYCENCGYFYYQELDLLLDDDLGDEW